MLVVVSPAKKLDMSPNGAKVKTSEPVFSEDIDKLVKAAGQLSEEGLRALMKISPALARLNKERFNNFGSQDRKPAAFAFAGDTYAGFDANSLDEDALRWAQEHMRILSGLYGLLRPLDEIEPYRLEMGSRLKVEETSDLYTYWGNRLANELNNKAKSTNSSILLNCASQEYFKAVDCKSLELEVITPQFFELTPNGPKQISFYAKKARGAMARYVVENRIDKAEDLIDFDLAGYSFQKNGSSRFSPAFFRKNS